MTPISGVTVETRPATARVAVYARVSTEEQAQGHSLAFQVDGCRAWAATNDSTVVDVYEDAGFSATSASRPAFQRLVADALAGAFDTVVVYKLDRFARSRHDSVVYKAKLRAAGVRVASATEPLDDSPASVITEGMLEVIAEWYSADLRQKVTAGLLKRAEKGLMNGMPPFGYRQSTDPAHEPPELVPNEAAAVRWAFEQFATGAVRMTEIADGLNARGFRTRYRPRRGTEETDGRAWTSQSVSALLANPVYAGYVTYHRQAFAPGAHEPIVDEELFRQVQRVRQSSRGRPAAPERSAYLLRGLVKCIGCGSNLQGNHSRSGMRYRYYRETAARRGVECDRPQVAIRADQLEAEVDRIVAGLEMPEDVRERVVELLADEGDDPEREQRLRERLRRLNRLYSDLQVEEADYDAQRRAIEAELDRIAVPAARAVQAAEHFDLLQAAWARADANEKRALAMTLIDAVWVDTTTKIIVEVVLQPAFRPWLDASQ